MGRNKKTKVKNVADVSGTATPGHLNFSPFGEAYVDDEVTTTVRKKPDGTEFYQVDYYSTSSGKTTVLGGEVVDSTGKAYIERKVDGDYYFLTYSKLSFLAGAKEGPTDSTGWDEYFKQNGGRYATALPNKVIGSPPPAVASVPVVATPAVTPTTEELDGLQRDVGMLEVGQHTGTASVPSVPQSEAIKDLPNLLVDMGVEVAKVFAEVGINYVGGRLGEVLLPAALTMNPFRAAGALNLYD